MKLLLFVEKIQDGKLWGRTSGVGGSFVTGYGDNLEGLLRNIRESMKKFQQHEGKNDPLWRALDIDAISFDIAIDDGGKR